jgi:hypothetical protein
LSGALSDLAVPQLALDAQGRVLLGADLDTPASGQSTANTDQTVVTVTGVKRRILFVTCKYSAAATVNVTVTLLSSLGAAWNTLLATLAFAANTDGLWVPAHSEFVIGPNDQIQVVAPAGGGGVTSAVAIYSEVLGLTSRAADATS